MVKLLSLKMQGIRSIGDKPQCIDFLHPLTLIQGENGTGKTTIIEALNNVTTGKVPTGKMGAFVHDLKIASKSRVDAQIQLQFLDARGNKCVATRRMTASTARNAAGVTIKSDEATLKFIDQGVERSISSKQASFFENIQQLLGVNSAVLNFVILCHQEDSCWPLSDSKDLKERFDKIFDVSEYVDIIDNLKVAKKDCDKKVGEITKELSQHLEGYVEQKAKIEADVRKSEKELATSTKNLAKLAEKIQSKKVEITATQSQFDELRAVQDDIKATKLKLELKETSLNDLDVPSFSGSRAQLEAELSKASSASDFKDAEKERKNIDRSIQECNQSIKDLDRKVFSTQEKLNKANVELELKERILAEAKATESRLREKFNIDDDDVGTALKSSKESKVIELKDLQRDYNTKKESIEAKVRELTDEIVTYRTQKRTYEQEADRLTKQLRQIQAELAKTKATEGSEAVTAKIEALKAEFEGQPTAKELEASLEATQKKRDSMGAELRLLEDLVAAEATEAKKKAMLEETLKQDADALKSLFETPPVANFQNRFKVLCNNLEPECRKAKTALDKHELEVSQITKKFDQLSMRIAHEESRINESKENIAAVGVDPESVKEKHAAIKEDLKKCRSELGEKQAYSVLYGKWEREIVAKKMCPCCDHAFTAPAEIDRVIKKVKKSSEQLPAEIEDLNETISSFEKTESSLSRVLPDVEAIQEILNKTIESQRSLTEIEEQKKSKAALRDRASTEYAELRRKLDLAKQLSGKASLLDRCVEDAKDAANKVSDLRSKLSEADSMEADNGTLEWKVDDLRESHAQLQTEITDLKQSLSSAFNREKKLVELERRKFEIDSAADKSVSLANEKTEKEAALREAQANASANDSTVPGLEKEKQALEAQLKKLTLTQNETVNAHQREIASFESALRQLEEQRQRVRKAPEGSDSVNGLKASLATLLESKSDAEKSKARLEAQRQQVMHKEDHVRTLSDQLRKLDFELEIGTLNANLGDLREKEELLAPVVRQLQQLKEELVKLDKQRDSNDFNINHLKKQIRERKTELKAPKMKQAVADYQAKYVERQINTTMSEDLSRYAECLDNSIIEFHTSRMELINEKLDKYWRTVYTAYDIDTIRIKAEPTKSTDKRKSYNYRVVMVVDNQEIEMKDRCSAGQKMLASILIRIALADVFAGGCPVLALDEPTTNLDVDKIENMATMLGRLVQEHPALQLIVITHDHDLVRHLHRCCRPEHVYRLSKDEVGVSWLKRHTNLDDD
uniref:AAA_15 domain-containing protein n=1 Tax=Panagrellus redivivus TaxID=6233 RepID=A0A7E4VZS3_PANRE